MIVDRYPILSCQPPYLLSLFYSRLWHFFLPFLNSCIRASFLSRGFQRPQKIHTDDSVRARLTAGTAVRSMGNDNVRSGFLSRGTDTFTLDRLDAILKNERISYDYEHDARLSSRFKRPPPKIRTEMSLTLPPLERVDESLRGTSWFDKACAVGVCEELLNDSTPLSISVTHLDATFSKFCSFRFEPLKESQDIIERAANLLERMPTWPLEFDDTPKEIPSEYRVSSIADAPSKGVRLWEQLQTTTYVSSIVLRVALSAVMEPGISVGLTKVPDVIAALLEIVSQLVSAASDDGTSTRLFVVRAFLWTCWQRCQMLVFYIEATNDLFYGSSDGKGAFSPLRGTLPSPKVTIQEMSKQRASLEKSAYMCGWNFELLRTNFVCIGADFRRFHQRYNALFGTYPARCVAGQLHACKGDSPKSCRRFQGMAIEDQSAHDQICFRNCRQLIWDETSYRSLSGARAVSLARTESHGSETWQYCIASEQTLAISHVWSQ